MAVKDADRRTAYKWRFTDPAGRRRPRERHRETNAGMCWDRSIGHEALWPGICFQTCSRLLVVVAATSVGAMMID